MNIAFVSPYDFAFPGGVNNHIEHLAREFTRRGHTVTIVAPSSKSAAQLGTPNLYPIGWPVPIRTAGSVARITFSAWRYAKVQALFRDHRFDIVHIHEPLVPLLALYALMCSNTTTLATFHQYRERSSFYPIAQAPLRRLLTRLDGRIAVSKPAADFMGQWFPGDYHVIPNGIDLEHFQRHVEPFPQFMDGKTNLLFVGRSEKRKGLKHLVSAYSRLKWRYPDLRLIVVGPGNPDSDTLRIIGERSLKDIVFTGSVPYDDLPRYYRSAHIFCAPSTGKESFGIVLLEAMATGAPVLASGIAGYAAVIQHGVNGFLVEPKDDASLADGIQHLLERPELRRSLGQTGKTFATRFTWPSVADQVMAYYASVHAAKQTGEKVLLAPAPTA
ncbi:MAG: glycosyltransferase family 1 protein [Dehalococcoidia bacterium]|nr:glycosyltransferase family 1 protein [Dehalococcoidia bacterium]